MTEIWHIGNEKNHEINVCYLLLSATTFVSSSYYFVFFDYLFFCEELMYLSICLMLCNKSNILPNYTLLKCQINSYLNCSFETWTYMWCFKSFQRPGLPHSATAGLHIPGGVQYYQIHLSGGEGVINREAIPTTVKQFRQMDSLSNTRFQIRQDVRF
jgi:hypothetical protein